VNFFHLTDLSVLSAEGVDKSVKEKEGRYIVREKRNERKGKKRKEKERKGNEGLDVRGGKLRSNPSNDTQ
jgi:hypothetical protein